MPACPLCFPPVFPHSPGGSWRGLMADRVGTWDGGYVRTDAHGRNIYVIRQQVNGKRYELSTRAFSVRAALEQLKRFQADPEGYDPRGERRPDPIYLNEELVREYIAYSREEKGNSRSWVTEQRSLLAWWAEKLISVDLRGASLREAVLPPLERAPGKSHKIAVLKAVYTWLRKVKREIALDEDPTAAGGLTMPPPRKPQRLSKAVSREHVERARKHLIGSWRDALDLQKETGWHVTEIQRFASDGDIEPPVPSQRELGIAGVLVVKHKSGEQHRTAVSATTLKAAQRLRERVGFSVAWYQRAVKAACKAAGLTPCCADTRSTPSSRFSVVVAEEPAQPLAATHPAVVVGCQRRIDQHIPQPLMVSLLVVVLQIL